MPSSPLQTLICFFSSFILLYLAIFAFLSFANSSRPLWLADAVASDDDWGGFISYDEVKKGLFFKTIL